MSLPVRPFLSVADRWRCSGWSRGWEQHWQQSPLCDKRRYWMPSPQLLTEILTQFPKADLLPSSWHEELGLERFASWPSVTRLLMGETRRRFLVSLTPKPTLITAANTDAIPGRAFISPCFLDADLELMWILELSGTCSVGDWSDSRCHLEKLAPCWGQTGCGNFGDYLAIFYWKWNLKQLHSGIGSFEQVLHYSLWIRNI